jgi:dinuclear metal center YbgI/SA1388 family protein
MASVASVCEVLQQSAPHQLAEEWDNVGLLVGESSRQVTRLMTCLTITPASAAEAVEQGVQMIITHHPLPFRELRRLTTDSTPGQLLLQLIEAGVAIYSSHTAFDSSERGINQQLAEGIGLVRIRPLLPASEENDLIGTGRVGELDPALSLDQLASQVSAFLETPQVQVVGETDRQIQRVAIACGSGGGLLEEARQAGCDLLLTGEARFHSCLEAEAVGLAVILAGHFASERFALEQLALEIAEKLPGVETFASRRESDPLRWVTNSSGSAG